MNCKQSWNGILTICRKAGKLTMGLEPARESLLRGEAAGILIASDVSARTRRQALFFSQQAQVPWLPLPFSKEEIGQIIGRGSGVIAVCSDGFFQRMQEIAAQTQTGLE